MHCSGTSATARIVNLLGVDMGPPEVGAPARRSNTRGLWEHPKLTRLGEEIMRTLGGSWDDPPALAPGWHRSPDLDGHREYARLLIESTFGDSQLWGWKDPRNCLLVPFWEDLLGPVSHVICVRNPRDVMASLERRDGMAGVHAKALWLRYTTEVLEATEQRPRLITCFEDLWSDPDAPRRLAAFLGRPGAADTREFRTALREWLDPRLWHHRAGVEDLPERDDEDAAGRLYATLCTRSRDPEAEPPLAPPG